MKSMCEAALKTSLTEIGFSEHIDLYPEDPCRGFFRVDDWWEEIGICRDAYRGSLTIRAGVELSEPHRYPLAIGDLLNRYPWDYSLGALHRVGDGLIFDHAYFQHPRAVAYDEYFREMLRMVEDGEFDILAHMDIVKRYGFEHYGPFDPHPFEAPIRAILGRLANKDLALEINTITLRRSVNEASPSRQILEWFRQEGGQWVTLGSDAHTPEDVGRNLEDALAILQESGNLQLASYHQRRKTPIPFK